MSDAAANEEPKNWTVLLDRRLRPLVRALAARAEKTPAEVIAEEMWKLFPAEQPEDVKQRLEEIAAR